MAELLRARARCPECQSIANVKNIAGEVVTLVKHGGGYFRRACLGITVTRADVLAWLESARARAQKDIDAETSARAKAHDEYHRALRRIDADVSAARTQIVALDKLAKKYGGGS